jgi:mycofactocin system glycosyltransferase
MTVPSSAVRLVPDSTLCRWDNGRTLAGGSPFRVLRLSETGAQLVDAWLDGEPADPRNRLVQRLVAAGMTHPVYDRARLEPTDVTVVVPTRDHDPGPLLAAIDTDAIVIDDGSLAPLPGADVRYETARGPAAARNTGWRSARTPLVAFLDADTVPEPGWLEPLLRHFEDPTVAAVAPRIRSLPGDTPLERYEQSRSSLDLGAEPGPVRPGSRISYVPSAALVVRTSALHDIGGFDEGMRFGEDVDLVWRLVERGRQVRYEPASAVGHAPRARWSAWLRKRFHYGTSAAPLARRHGDAVAPVRMSVWSALTWTSVLAGKTGIGVGIAAVTTALLPRKLDRVGVPAPESLRLAAHGNLGAGRLLADAIGRSWAPLAVPLLSRTHRGRLLLGLVLGRHLLEWVHNRPPLDPIRWTAARAADDLAYSVGVWWGALRHHTAAPLLPHFLDIPGRSSINVTEHGEGSRT